MALSATTEKARLCYSTSSSNVIYSQAVSTQFFGQHKLQSLVKGLVPEFEASFKLCVPLQNRQEGVVTCLLEPWATGRTVTWPGDTLSGPRTPFADWIPRDVAQAGGSPAGLRRNLVGLMSASGLAPTSLPNAVFATVALLSTKLAKSDRKSVV